MKAEQLSLRDIRGVIPISGVFRIEPEKWSSVFGAAEQCRVASPLSHVVGNHPPFLILYADKDFKGCAQMSKDFSAALQGNHGEAHIQEISNRDHMSVVRNMTNQDDPARKALLEFIAAHVNAKTPDKAKN